MTWQATGKPLKVDESLPIDADEPTQEEIDAAERNWEQMDAETKAYLVALEEKAEQIVKETL